MGRFLLATALLLCAATARADLDVGRYVLDPGGRVRGVRATAQKAGGRRDLVVLLDRTGGRETGGAEVLVLRAPTVPDAKTWFRLEEATRIPCGEAGPLASAGALVVGRLGPAGELRLRFLGPEGAFDVDPAAPAQAPQRVGGPTLLARGAGAAPVFWNAVADLDGDGRDECWWPDASGVVAVAGLTLRVEDEAQRSVTELVYRKARVPHLEPADLDGDGRQELVRLEGTTLRLEHAAHGGAPARASRIELPFLAPDPTRPPEELRTPRLALEDVDGDGITDLLVTIVAGRADKIGGLRTTLYHLPGPIADPATGALREPKVRLDTESVALHPRFVDVTGDGALDYVADSIRGNTLDLVRRVMGAEPEITYTVFRFDRAAGTFERTPYVTLARPYSAAQARANTFGASGFFGGDFDGDGVKDLLDLGNLTGVDLLQGSAKEGAFTRPLLGRTVVGKDGPLLPDAVVADLDGDGRADAVTWSETRLFLLAPRSGR